MLEPNDFRSQLRALAADAAHRPERYGAGVRLLFSCGSRDMMAALAVAEAVGIDARGVGRKHILVEVEDVSPTEAWIASNGVAIADYFERIGGADPQIAVDRAFA
jgi:hypothetical protein